MNSKVCQELEVKKGWFAVATKPRQEEIARENLQRQNYRVIYPRLRLRKRKSGRWVTVDEAMFPGYVFVELNMGKDDSAPIKSTIGCKGLVWFGENPKPIHKIVMEPLIEMGETPLEVESHFGFGDRVQIENGPFEGLEAIYVTPKGRDRVSLLVNILGRQNEIEIDSKEISRPE